MACSHVVARRHEDTATHGFGCLKAQPDSSLLTVVDAILRVKDLLLAGIVVGNSKLA
jgi:hypothetical protein